MNQPIIDLAGRAWRIHSQSKDREFLVTPSAPVLYFGGFDAFLASPMKVITVGLNPSQAEFPSWEPFKRFPGAVSEEPLSYLSALNGYFRRAPYSAWFNPAFEPLLNGMQASYYDGEANTALHTDLCSPLATNPTWSKLSPIHQSELQSEGVELWHDLVRHLRPDVILISVAEKYLQLIEFEIVDAFEPIFTVERKNPYVVKAGRIAVCNDIRSLIVFGRASQLPFGSISAETKLDIGWNVRGICLGGR